MLGAFVISVVQLIVRYDEMFGFGWNWLSKLYYSLPLSAYSLAWLPVSILLYAAVRFLPEAKAAETA